MRPDSLRALGGDDRTFTVDDPRLAQKIRRLLEEVSATDAAQVALDTNAELYSALQYLTHNNKLTTQQYNLLAEAIANTEPKEALPKTAELTMIFTRMSLERLRIYDCIGWNKYPTDNDPGLDVYI